MTKFQQRYLLPFLLLLSIVGAIYIWLVLDQQTQLLITELKLKGTNLAEHLAQASHVDVLLGDNISLEELLEEAKAKEEDMLSCALYTLEKSSVVQVDTLFTFIDTTSLVKQTYDYRDYLTVITPILDQNGNIIGLSGVDLSKARVQETIQTMGWRLAITGILAFGLVGYFVYFLMGRIKLLVDQEAQKAKEIEKAYVQLQDLQVVLQETNESLEERVKERTLSLKSTNKELQNANGELKDFAYIVSHDLKAPLRAIGSLTEWIIEDYSEELDEDGQEQLGLLNNRVDRMHGLIEGILKYSRVGRVDTIKEVVKIDQIIEQVIQNLKQQYTFEFTLNGTLPTIHCNPSRIKQIFQALLTNALEFNDKSSPIILLKATENDTHYQFKVIDNGTGIPQKDLEKIFKIFYSTERPKGAESKGMGLTLTKRIVESYDGLIMVESTLKEGTVLTFTLAKEAVAQRVSVV